MKIRWHIVFLAISSIVFSIYLLIVGFDNAVGEKDLDAVSCAVVSCWIYEWHLVITAAIFIFVFALIALLNKWEKLALYKDMNGKRRNKSKNEDASKTGSD